MSLSVAWLRRTGIVVALGACLLVAALAFADGRDPAPSFSLRTLDGKTLTRDSLKGKVVLLDFWATWCGPCLKAIPEIKDLRQKNAGQPLLIVSVSVDDSQKAVEEFASRNGMDWTQVWDGEMKAVSAFGVDSFPTYIILDPQGRIAYRQRGWAPVRSAEALGSAVSRELAEIRKGAPAAKGATKVR